MSKLSTINHDRRLYVLECGEGFSCLGFDVAAKWQAQVATWLGRPDLLPSEVEGTPAAYDSYLAAMEAGRAYHAATGQRCNAQLSPELIGKEGKRVRVTLPSGEKESFFVGKSSGWMPIHLALKTGRSSDGCGVYVPAGSQVELL